MFFFVHVIDWNNQRAVVAIVLTFDWDDEYNISLSTFPTSSAEIDYPKDHVLRAQRRIVRGH